MEDCKNPAAAALAPASKPLPITLGCINVTAAIQNLCKALSDYLENFQFQAETMLPPGCRVAYTDGENDTVEGEVVAYTGQTISIKCDSTSRTRKFPVTAETKLELLFEYQFVTKPHVGHAVQLHPIVGRAATSGSYTISHLCPCPKGRKLSSCFLDGVRGPVHLEKLSI